MLRGETFSDGCEPSLFRDVATATLHDGDVLLLTEDERTGEGSAERGRRLESRVGGLVLLAGAVKSSKEEDGETESLEFEKAFFLRRSVDEEEGEDEGDTSSSSYGLRLRVKSLRICERWSMRSSSGSLLVSSSPHQLGWPYSVLALALEGEGTARLPSLRLLLLVGGEELSSGCCLVVGGSKSSTVR